VIYRFIPFAIVCAALAQEPAAQPPKAPTGRFGESTGPRVSLFFREEWKTVSGGAEHGVTQEQVSNPNLELKLYGTASNQVQVLGNADDPSNPPHVWTGLSAAPVVVALRDKNNFADLTGLARIRWTTKVSGFHKIRPAVKLADGTWLVGDHEDGSTVDWHVSEVSIPEVRWLRLDANKVVTHGNFVEHPDLSKVDEIGFADLLPGSGHGPGGWVDVAAIEVYGKTAPRTSSAK
jgi:hypothetical protein